MGCVACGAESLPSSVYSYNDPGDTDTGQNSTHDDNPGDGDGPVTTNGLNAVYFKGTSFNEKVLERTDARIDFAWHEGAPDPKVGADTFSVRWSGFIKPRFTETYTFTVFSDDGVGLWIDSEEIIANWTDHSEAADQGTVSLMAGELYPLRMEYYENRGDATITLLWASESQATQIVPSSVLYTSDAPIDLCPDDPDKTEPGGCGCGNPEDSCDPVITASHDDSPAGEEKERAFDNDVVSKWLIFQDKGWIQYEFGGDITRTVKGYTVTSGNDYPARDPSDWILMGRNGSSWVSVDSRSCVSFTERFETKSYTIAEPRSFHAYRIDISATRTITKPKTLQLAEIGLMDIPIGDDGCDADTCCHNDSWKFIVYGDTRSSDDDHRDVLRTITERSPDYRFIINVGDVVKNGDNGSQWRTWKKACDDELGGTGQNSDPPKYMAVPGNHDDLDEGEGRDNWKRYLSGQYRQFGNGGQFFVFDYENARFVILNSERGLGGDQLRLLENAIETNTRTWLFAIWHTPIFPFGQKSYEDGIHEEWGKRLYRAGCDLIFSGHAHYYARTKKLKLDGSSKPPLDNANGTVQIVTGVGAVGPSDLNPGSREYMLAGWDDKSDGYTELNVEGDTLILNHISDKGELIDSTAYAPNFKRVKSER